MTSFGCGNPLAFAGVQAGETIVDLGSGAGYDLLVAAAKVGPEGQVIGVDMTDAMIEAARANAAQAGQHQIEVRKGLIEELPVADGTADWVISNCVINLSPEKHRVFAEIDRVLKPGGRFSISDIVAEDLPLEVQTHAKAYAACVAGAIPEETYVAGLMAAGLTDIEVSERHVYSAAEIRTFVGAEIEHLGLEPAELDARLPSLVRQDLERPFHRPQDHGLKPIEDPGAPRASRGASRVPALSYSKLASRSTPSLRRSSPTAE